MVEATLATANTALACRFPASSHWYTSLALFASPYSLISFLTRLIFAVSQFIASTQLLGRRLAIQASQTKLPAQILLLGVGLLNSWATFDAHTFVAIMCFLT